MVNVGSVRSVIGMVSMVVALCISNQATACVWCNQSEPQLSQRRSNTSAAAPVTSTATPTTNVATGANAATSSATSSCLATTYIPGTV